MDIQICKKCEKTSPAYLRACEHCGTDLFEDEPVLDAVENSADSKKVDSILIGIVGTLTIFFGGILWLIIAGVIYLPFRNQKNSWLFFIVPWVILQVVGMVIIKR